jgi:uncharacterized BrkB/YihY/UPF0761 family membrane protein
VRPAIVTALLWMGLELFSAVYFAPAIVSDSRLYGTIGVVFSFMAWFIAIGAVIVLGAVAGTTWNQRKAIAAGEGEREGEGEGKREGKGEGAGPGGQV